MVDRRQALGPVGWCLAAAILFGATTPATKSLVDGMGPLLLSGLLYWGAAVAVSPVAARQWRKSRAYRRQNRGRLLGAVAFGGVAGPVLLLWGLSLAPAGSVSLWLTLECVATAVLARLFFREHLAARGWLATALVLGASAGLAEPASGGTKAALLVALACIAWGLDNNLTSLIDGYSPAEVTWVKGVCAGMITVPAGLLLGGQASLLQILSALLVGAVGYGISLVLYIAGAQQLGAIRSQLYFSTAPLFGLAASWAFLGEAVGPKHGVAVVLMGAAVLLLLRDRHEHEHHHGAMEHSHWHRHDDGHHEHEHSAAPWTWHQHRHQHAALTHSHPHRPDLHHRHAHGVK